MVVVVVGRAAGQRREGTETRAERGLRRVRVRVLGRGLAAWRPGFVPADIGMGKRELGTYCHSMAALMEGKVVGREER